MKKILFLVVCVFILFISWENQKEDMVIASSSETVIPEESIRLRIIANSDLAEDQWIKREVRDVVVDEVNNWIGKIDNIDEARLTVNEHLEELNKIIASTVEKNGYSYADDIKVELGTFPFPTKMYGQLVYPAGDYEALRITLGEGTGQNWWCVLFPPLCFVDMDQSVVSEETEEETKIDTDIEENNEEVEVKFFIVELFDKITSAIKTVI